MPVNREKRSQAERRNRSEEAMLDGAATLIAERGVEGTSLASIGERAGVSRGLPNHHFGSKDALVARLARRAQDGITAATLDALEQAQQRIDEISALDLLSLTVDTYLDLLMRPASDQRALIVMWASTFPSRSSVDGMAEADQRSYDGWADLIARGQEEGSIRKDLSAKAASVVLLGLVRGVAGTLLTDPGVTGLEEVRQMCHDWITTALAPTPTPRQRPDARYRKKSPVRTRRRGP
jgi:AcrR family transcriptional regulator